MVMWIRAVVAVIGTVAATWALVVAVIGLVMLWAATRGDRTQSEESNPGVDVRVGLVVSPFHLIGWLTNLGVKDVVILRKGFKVVAPPMANDVRETIEATFQQEEYPCKRTTGMQVRTAAPIAAVMDHLSRLNLPWVELSATFWDRHGRAHESKPYRIRRSYWDGERYNAPECDRGFAPPVSQVRIPE